MKMMAGDKVTRKFLANNRSAFDEILFIKKKEINRFEKLPGGVIIYGGGAKMSLIIDLAKERLRLPVRFAKPEIEWYQETSDLSLIPVLGLLLLRAQGQREGFISLEDGVLGKAFRFFKNIFSI